MANIKYDQLKSFILLLSKNMPFRLKNLKNIFETIHKKALKIIQSFIDDELFVKQYFNYAKSTNIGSYAISLASTQYDCAIKNIKQKKAENVT